MLLTGLKSLIRRSISDEFIIDGKFFRAFGRHINFYNPKTFNEKLQVQKIYVRNPKMTQLADKHEVRKYIQKKGYKKILNDLIGVYDRPEDIDFETLPNKFVIKCNHSWDTNIICPDKSLLDERKVISDLKKWMNHNHYHKLREWCYKDIKPKITIERYLDAPLKDYKFFCFSGAPLYIQVDSDRSEKHILDMYDIEWNRLECKKGHNSRSSFPEPKPDFFDDMFKIAQDLSSGFNFCRVDFLANHDGFYFAEITFYPGGGYSAFEPEEFDYLFGQHFSIAEARIPLQSHFSIWTINLLTNLKHRVKPETHIRK